MIFERDDARAEVRRGLAGFFYFWAKIDGLGNISVNPATATIHRPNGEQIGAEQNLIVAPAASASRLKVILPAIDELGEDYFAVIKFTPYATQYEDDFPDQIFERVHQVQFDVVLQPWGESRISINELETKHSSIRARLTRIAERWDNDAEAELDVDVNVAASIFAANAHTELYRRIKNKVSIELNSPPPSRALSGFPAHYYTRPRLIVDRLALHPIEVAIAMAMIFEHDLTDGEDQREAEKLAKHWNDRATSMLVELGGLRYDTTEDRVADTTIQKLAGTVVARRKQAG